MNDIPTVGEWYQKMLSKPIQIAFNISCRILGDTLSIELFGYRKFVKKHINNIDK